MKVKLGKIAAAILAALLVVALCLPVSAAEWEGEDFVFDLPEEFVYTLTPATGEDDPTWALIGIGDPSTRLQNFREMNVVAEFYTEDGKTGLTMTQRSNDTSQNVYSLKELGEEDKAKFLENLLQARTDQITIEKSYVDVGGQPFFRLKTDGKVEENEIHSLLYGTIFNGHTLNFELYTGEAAATEEQIALLESAVNSVRITKVLEKPVPKVTDALPSLLMLAALLLVAIIPLVYLPIRARREKREKARMADRLSEYHRTRGSDGAVGEILFANSTDCTREAIHSFSLYQAFVKRLPSLVLGCGVCLLVLVASFWIDAEWWLKLLAVAVTVFEAYKIISMPGNIEKVQKKVIERGVSSTARYAFYDEGFRVSGIQSASVYPYFQITEVRRHGHYLYLYYGPDNAYLVDQYGFTLGEFEDFVRFIGEKAKK